MDVTINGFALVTGAGSGIGRDCALAYAAAGAAGVAFADLNLGDAEQALIASKAIATNPKYRAIALEVDVSKEDSVNELVSKVTAVFGRLDYALNSAGIGVQHPAETAEASIDEFDAFYQVNVRGTLLFTKAVSRAMKKQSSRTVQGRNGGRDIGRGSIINMGSASSYVPTKGITQYTTAKHAVMGVTKNAAIDNAAYGIRVNAVCPSWVQGPMMDRAFEGNPGFKDYVLKAIPLGRLALPEEVSETVMFLSSPASSYVTGVGWIIDGGATLQMQT